MSASHLLNPVHLRRLALVLMLALGCALVAACGGDSTVAPVDAGGPAAEAAAVPALEPQAAPKVARERKLVVLDPGHGGDEVGSATNGVVEKASNLDLALRVEQLLAEQGIDVLLTRRTDARAAAQQPGFTATRSDIQARIDLANAAAADVFVSIHSNGSSDPSQRGVEVWYDSSRSFAEANLRLAILLKQHVLAELRGYGYAALDRGLLDGQCFRRRGERCVSLFVLGGEREITRREVEQRGGDPEALGIEGDSPAYSRAAAMPGALLEALIVTNPSDAAVLRDDAGRQAMARGMAAAIVAFLAAADGG